MREKQWQQEVKAENAKTETLLPPIKIYEPNK